MDIHLPPRSSGSRRVGFQHDGLQRKFGGKVAQFAWSSVSYGTAEAQLETELDECLGLLAAAVKGMSDATRDAEAA